jgi:hypothetical protein
VLHLTTLPTGDARVVISQDGIGNGGAPLTIDPANRTGTFIADANLKPGRYLVRLIIDGRAEPVPVPGELRVLSDNLAPVHLDEIYPAIRYPDDPDTIDIVGTNFSALPSDNQVEFLGQAAIPFGTGQDCIGPTYAKPCVLNIAGMEGHRIRIAGLHDSLKDGAIRIHVRVGETAWSNALSVTTSPRTVSAIRIFAVAVLAILAIFIYLLAKRAAQTQTAGSGLNAISVLLLDPETDTYSLSKFQVLVWTGIFIFSYVYLALCRTLVQWTFDWPPVPKNLPELLGLSAGAGVVAAGISSFKGTKGAGGIRPSAVDFITTGGIVAAERFQFFIWTLVGGLTFLYIVLRINPATLQELPAIPDTFLYLMGFSSVAYLGGKLARKPGPVVKNTSVLKVTQLAAGDAEMTITLEGENLHQNATFRIDGEQIRAGQMAVTTRVPEQPQDGFCTRVELVIREAAKYAEGVHTLTVINPDGQSADVSFPVSPLVITEVNVAKLDTNTDTNSVNLKIKGTNFVGPIVAQWLPENSGAPVAGTVNRTSEVAMTVTLPAGTTGVGKLVLVSTVGLRRTYPLTIT